MQNNLLEKANQKKKKLAKKYQIAFIIVGVFFPLFSFLVFWIPTNLTSLLMSFKSTLNGEVVYNLDNFRMLFDEFRNPFSEIRESLGNTLIFFFFGLLVQLPLCFLFSYFLYKKVYGYKIFRYIFYLPSIISGVVLSSVVLFMAKTNGPLAIIWEKVFNNPAPAFFWDSRYAIPSMLVYGLWSGFGSSLIFYTAAMIKIPESIIEYVNVDGANMFTELFKIIIPLVWPTLSIFILQSFVGIFSSSGPILLFTQGKYKTYTLSFWIYAKTVGISGTRLEYAAAVGLFFTILATPISLFVKWLMDRIEPVEY